MGKLRNRIVFVFAFFFVAIFLPVKTAPLAWSQEKTRLVIAPFDIHTRASKEFLFQAFHDALVRELSGAKEVEIVDIKDLPEPYRQKPPDEKKMEEMGESLKATYVITGSLSEIGNELNADVRIYDVKAKRPLLPLSAHGRGLESISAIASRLKNEILIRVSARLRIAKIEFKGNEKIETAVLNQAIKSTQGGLYSESLIATDIKEIYKLGYFEDVAVDVSDTPEGKIIVYQVKERGLITDIVFQGNKAVKKDDLEATITFKTRQVLNTGAIASSLEKLKELYDGKGYYNAEIKYRIEPVRPKEVRVVFDIKENDRLYVKKISFEGNHTFKDKELKKLMKTEERGLFSWFSDAGILKRDQLLQDVNKITVHYFNNGFIYAQVGEPEVTFDKKGIYIKISIVEGKRFKVGKVTIEGDTLKTPRAELFQKLTVTKNVFFDRGAVIKDVETLTEACNDEGYAYADVNPETQAHDKEQTVDVTYRITKGPLVYFNRINIAGNTKTRDKVIRRILAFSEGDLYNKTKLKDSYKNLERTKFFEEIDFQAERGPDETLTDIAIRVKEKQTGMFSVGVAYSALDGAMAMASISQQNLFGRAQSLSLKATIGQNAHYYDLTFIEPWLFDTNIWSRFELWNTVRYYDSYTLDTSGISPTLGYPIWPKYNIYGYLQYGYSQSRLKDIAATASDIIKAEEGTYTMSALTPTLTRDTTDDPYFPTKGSIASIYTTLAGGPLGGNTHFLRHGANGAWYKSLPFFDAVFDIKGRIGCLQSIKGEAIPVYELYYVGGINSVRGLRYVGPKDPVTGDLIGGKTMLTFNFDLVFPLVREAGIRGVIFFDTGNAWENGYHLDDMRKTAGLGVRWYSPIGPLRLEWGYVLDRKEGEAASRFEFTMGTLM
ncbi:MAG TPA: outer membrane protein assembly factor BamA [Syntrophales bacterium]|nr:outer membrane protein assembly factor BamA [Syntrophales bacterium]HOL59333.1 outer membrane protein assembly factor BamA [Syntrophales bacterium]HPO35474.1 outer membrane protein assembly factor BamA [Syntrophales bacterium]